MMRYDRLLLISSIIILSVVVIFTNFSHPQVYHYLDEIITKSGKPISTNGETITSSVINWSSLGTCPSGSFVSGFNSQGKICSLPPVDGSGSANFMAKWSDSDTLISSSVREDSEGNLILNGGTVTINSSGGISSGLNADKLDGYEAADLMAAGSTTSGNMPLKGNIILYQGTLPVQISPAEAQSGDQEIHRFHKYEIYGPNMYTSVIRLPGDSCDVDVYCGTANVNYNAQGDLSGKPGRIFPGTSVNLGNQKYRIICDPHSGTVLFSDNFEDGNANGWNLGGSGVGVKNYGYGYSPPLEGNYNLYLGSSNGNYALFPINLQGQKHVYLSFRIYYDRVAYYCSDSNMKLEMYDKNGNWRLLKQICSANGYLTLSLPEEYYGSNNKIRFKIYNPKGLNVKAIIDDVTVSTSRLASYEIINYVMVSYDCAS